MRAKRLIAFHQGQLGGGETQTGAAQSNTAHSYSPSPSLSLPIARSLSVCSRCHGDHLKGTLHCCQLWPHSWRPVIKKEGVKKKKMIVFNPVSEVAHRSGMNQLKWAAWTSERASEHSGPFMRWRRGSRGSLLFVRMSHRRLLNECEFL